MKKTLVALAVLGAATFTAQAATVTLYGAVDGGFTYTYHQKKSAAKDSDSSFKLDDGIIGSNKFGIKGEEELGNGLAVGFKLENGFHIANGAMNGTKANPNTLFDREARLYVKGAFGELAAGRVGALGSASGSYDMFFGNGDAFDGGDQVGTGFVVSGKLNNSLTYVSPSIAGAQVYAQYSFSKVNDQKDKFNKNDRQWGLGATFTMDNFAVAGLVEQGIPATHNDTGAVISDKKKKPVTFGLGANVTLDNLKLFGAVQYAKHATEISGLDVPFTDAKNVAGTLGGVYTMGQNEFTVAGYLGHAKQNTGTNGKTDYMSLNGRYVYNLSARTSLYAGADFAHTKATVQAAETDNITKQNIFTVYTGLHHNF